MDYAGATATAEALRHAATAAAWEAAEAKTAAAKATALTKARDLRRKMIRALQVPATA